MYNNSLFTINQASIIGKVFTDLLINLNISFYQYIYVSRFKIFISLKSFWESAKDSDKIIIEKIIKRLFESLNLSQEELMRLFNNLSKEEAYRLMECGYKITHDYYSNDEFLRMRDDGVIFDEKGYKMGSKNDNFWLKNQKWKTGWSLFNN